MNGSVTTIYCVEICTYFSYYTLNAEKWFTLIVIEICLREEKNLPVVSWKQSRWHRQQEIALRNHSALWTWKGVLIAAGNFFVHFFSIYVQYIHVINVEVPTGVNDFNFFLHSLPFHMRRRSTKIIIIHIKIDLISGTFITRFCASRINPISF